MKRVRGYPVGIISTGAGPRVLPKDWGNLRVYRLPGRCGVGGSEPTLSPTRQLRERRGSTTDGSRLPGPPCWGRGVRTPCCSPNAFH